MYVNNTNILLKINMPICIDKIFAYIILAN
jgi:hypothetical protein